MQRKSKKSNDPDVKGRDRERMEVYDCGGLLHINVFPHSGYISVRVAHLIRHNEYITIGLSAEVKQFIKDHTHLTTTMVRCQLHQATECDTYNKTRSGTRS